MGSMYDHLAHHGAGYVHQSNPGSRRSILGSANIVELQPAYQARRLLHAERLPRDTESAGESVQLVLELADPQPETRAPPRGTRPTDLWSLCCDLLFNASS